MFRARDIEGLHPNKFNHSKRGYQIPLDGPYNSQTQRVAPTNNIWGNQINYSPSNTNNHFRGDSPTRLAAMEIQTRINQPINHNANNQKHLVDEEIFQRQRGKGAIAVDKDLYAIEKYNSAKLQDQSYNKNNNYQKPQNVSDSLDRFHKSYVTQSTGNYHKNLHAFFGLEHTASPGIQLKNQPAGNYGSQTKERFSVGSNNNDLNSSFNGSYSPKKDTEIHFGLDRTRPYLSHPKADVSSNLIQQKTLNRTWAEASYHSTNPITHQPALNPVAHQKDSYFVRPNVFGNGVHNRGYVPR